MNDYSRHLINLLIDKTVQGLLPWRQGGSLGEYRVELNFATFSILRSYNANSELCIIVNLFKENGQEINIAKLTSDNIDFLLLENLYTSAESYYRKDTEEIINVINTLAKL